MVEPLTSVVYNTLLSGRSKFHSIARTAVTSSSHSALGPHFFTPQPRRVKGKYKSHDVPEEAPLDRSLREWSSSRPLFWWPFHTHPMMLDELSHGDEKALSVKRLNRPQPRARIVRSPLTMPAQRRHSSHVSERSPASKGQPSISDFSRHEQRIQRFQRIIEQPRSEVDLDHAWQTYQSALRYDLPLTTKMSFVDKFISAAELGYRSNTPKERLTELSERAEKIINDLEPSIAPGTRFDQWRLCLLSRTLALRRLHKDALKAIREADDIPLKLQHKAGIPYAYEMILTSIVRSEGNIRAMEVIGENLEDLWIFIDYETSSTGPRAHQRAAVSLRTVATRIANETTDPLPFLEKKDWDQKRRAHIGCFFIQSFAHAQLGLEGRDVLTRMQELHLHVPHHIQALLIRSLARRSATAPAANALFQNLPHDESDLPYKRLGLFLYGRQGAVETAENFFNSIEETSEPSPDDIAALIHTYAMADNVKRAEETFEKFFPLEDGRRRGNSPALSHYAAIIYAHARQGEVIKDGITHWLTDMANQDLVPNEHVFTIVLNAFAAAGDLESTMAILEQMRDAGVRANVVTYTIVITLLAHRKDPMGAEAVFKRALREGVVPDNRMIVSVMNAHVEGGSWHGVIRAYDYVSNARISGLSLEVYNTLMKAYVLIGAPFNVVYKFFKRLEQTKAKPDAYTYSLLVQSACDAGLMKIAADIYYDMEALYKDSPDRNLDANVYVLTILMAGFLQHGDKVKAKAVYDEMLELGIQPSAITFSIILKAYGNEKTKASLEIAEAFIKSLVSVPEEERTWKKPKYDSLSALNYIYGPVLAGYARMSSPEDVERVYQDMQEAGGPPSLGTLTVLLDVYRRTFNVDGIREVWPQIHELGMSMTSRDWMTPEDGTTEITRGIRGNILCVPLSIYIDALSAAGEHADVAAVWKDMRARGFSFDSNNWNHLAVALVRAGQVERAFEVIERVIIPYQELSINSNKARDRNPSSPLLSDVLSGSEEEEREDEAAIRAMRGIQRTSAARLSQMKTRHMEAFHPEYEDENSEDFAYHLHILHQISPSWATWRAHNATLSVLLIAYNHLNGGRLIKATGTPEDVEEDPNASTKAREMLNRIYSNYPKTVERVLQYDTKMRQKLQPEQYDRYYTWG